VPDRRVAARAGRAPAVAPARPARARAGAVRVAAIGCGNYASTMLLPHLGGRPDVELVEVVTQAALSGANAAEKHGFARMSTDHTGVLADESIDAVLILTRHSSHARLACEALRAGKAVFVEKPLALDDAELATIADVVAETGNDRLMVGFNRRWAPLLTDLKRAWGERVGPHVVQYRVNAGRVDPKSWYADALAEGSRFVGEGGHFIDTISWWLGADPVEVTAARAGDDRDNTVVTLRYPDGSLGVVSYLTAGDGRYPKEVMEVFGQGAVAKLDNFARTELWRNGKSRVQRALGGVDKGQKAEMAAFIDAVKAGGAMPVPLSSVLATTHATVAAPRSAARAGAQAVLPDARAAGSAPRPGAALESELAQ
jgi:predicted dehydrogenase